MKAHGLTHSGGTVSVQLRANGIDWTFAHTRSTGADAQNLVELLHQQEVREDAREADVRANAQVEIETLRRSNAALRGYIGRMKRATSRNPKS